MYDRLKDLLVENRYTIVSKHGKKTFSTKEARNKHLRSIKAIAGASKALRNTNDTRSEVLKGQPGAKRNFHFSTTMAGTLTNAAKARLRLRGKPTTEKPATSEPANNKGGTKATTINVPHGPKTRA